MDYHSLVKIKAELDQFIEGLNTLDVLSFIRKHSKLMGTLFCHQLSKLSKGRLDCTYYVTIFCDFPFFFYLEYFKKFDCVFSTDNAQRKAKEEASYIFFMDFLEECEGMLSLYK